MEWHYTQNQNQHGPVTEAELRSMISNGSIATTEHVWREGMAEWVPISDISELVGPVASPAGSGVAIASPPEPPSPYQAPASVQPGSMQASGDVPNYLWQSIVVTLLCCVPLGVPAIVYASKVDGLKRSGDYTAAKAASDSAKTWCWVAFGVGLVTGLLYFILVVAAEVGSSSGY